MGKSTHTNEIEKACDKVEKTLREWEKLKKNKENKAKCSNGIKLKEDKGKVELKDLFNIFPANALNLIHIQEDKEFLMA